MSRYTEQYPGQLTEDLADLVARALALGLFAGSEHAAGLATRAEDLVNAADPHAAETPRCSVCAEILATESWDTPVLYCPNACDVDVDTALERAAA